jgi:hypothetical protein
MSEAVSTRITKTCEKGSEESRESLRREIFLRILKRTKEAIVAFFLLSSFFSLHCCSDGGVGEWPKPTVC